MGVSLLIVSAQNLYTLGSSGQCCKNQKTFHFTVLVESHPTQVGFLTGFLQLIHELGNKNGQDSKRKRLEISKGMLQKVSLTLSQWQKIAH